MSTPRWDGRIEISPAAKAPPASLPLDPFDAAAQWRWYGTRRVKGGPEVAAELVLLDGDRDLITGELLSDQALEARIDGADALMGPGVVRGWPWRPILEAEWRYLTEMAAHARQYEPHHPLAMPMVNRRAALAAAPLPF